MGIRAKQLRQPRQRAIAGYRRIARHLRAALLAIGLATASVDIATAAETLLVRNALGYTMGAGGLQRFAGFEVVDGKVTRVFATNADIPQAVPGTEVLDCKGATVLPGLIDAHGHVLGLGQERSQAELRGSASLAEALQRAKTFAAQNADSTWVRGRGWNQELWPTRAFPTAADLDRAVSDRPVILERVDGHAIWVNTRAMQMAGITPSTPDPSGGQIVRDAKGAPTGVFVDKATALIESKVAPPTPREIERNLSIAMKTLAGLGITGVHDAGIDMQTYESYRALGKKKELPIRIYAMLADRGNAREVIAKGVRGSEFDDRLQLRAVKAWVDGALGSRGAALLSDYSDRAGHRGLAIYSQDAMTQLAKLASANGWQLNIHAIGDAGNRVALNAFQAGYTADQRLRLRPRIEHAQVIALDDIKRFAELNVIASIQPTHATSDMNMAEDRLGHDRIQGAYAWRKLLASGAKLAGGSDFPVELPNPFHGLYAAVTRQSSAGKPPGGWYANEKLTREEALRLFTTDAAFAAHQESHVGSIAPGQWADFILIDRDYFNVPAERIYDSRVLATYVSGKKVDTR